MNKYDWSNVPKDVEFLATDSNGCVFGYDMEPVEKDFGKFMNTSDFLYFPKMIGCQLIEVTGVRV